MHWQRRESKRVATESTSGVIDRILASSHALNMTILQRKHKRRHHKRKEEKLIPFCVEVSSWSDDESTLGSIENLKVTGNNLMNKNSNKCNNMVIRSPQNRRIQQQCHLHHQHHGLIQMKTGLNHSDFYDDNTNEDFYQDDLEYRLSMAGLKPLPLVDELWSDLYSSTLDSLRSKIERSIPQTAEMLSKAIINAFNAPDCVVQRNSDTTIDQFISPSSSYSPCTDSLSMMSAQPQQQQQPLDPMQLEVDAIREVYEWVNLNQFNHQLYNTISSSSNALVVEDQRTFDFMQKLLNSIVLHIRYNRLSANAACTILTNVAIVLGMSVTGPVHNDTVILARLSKETTTDDIQYVFSAYGQVRGVAIAENGGFAICRFCDAACVRAVTEKKSMHLLGSAVDIIAL